MPAMTPDEMNTLAGRVEAATGSDRELDALIARAVGYRQLADVYEKCAGHWISPVDIARKQAWEGWVSTPEPPEFTASLDAAMTLVPEGCRFVIDSDGCHCRITKPDDPNAPWNGWPALAATMPLALTAAALRARANQGATDE